MVFDASISQLFLCVARIWTPRLAVDDHFVCSNSGQNFFLWALILTINHSFDGINSHSIDITMTSDMLTVDENIWHFVIICKIIKDFLHLFTIFSFVKHDFSVFNASIVKLFFRVFGIWTPGLGVDNDLVFFDCGKDFLFEIFCLTRGNSGLLFRVIIWM